MVPFPSILKKSEKSLSKTGILQFKKSNFLIAYKNVPFIFVAPMFTFLVQISYVWLMMSLKFLKMQVLSR